MTFFPASLEKNLLAIQLIYTYIYIYLADVTIRNITRHHDLHNRPCLTTACIVRFEDLRMKNEHPLLNSNPPKSSRMHPTLFPASLNKNPTLPFRVFDHLDFKGKYPPHERCVCVFWLNNSWLTQTNKNKQKRPSISVFHGSVVPTFDTHPCTTKTGPNQHFGNQMLKEALEEVAFFPNK